MSEILTIRLNNDPSEPIPWLVWSVTQQEVIASGEADNLIQLTAYSKDREVIALADSSAMTLLNIDIPPGSERQLENVLPFLLEDELAQDVSHVHITLLGKLDGKAQVAVIEHKILQAWLSSLSEAHLNPRRIIPDCLCLPKDDDKFSAVILNHRWIIRTSQMQGFSAEGNWLEFVLNSIQQQQEEPLAPIVSFSGIPEHSEFEWKNEPAELVMELLTKEARENKFTLLTGRYKPTTQYAKYIRVWRDAVIVAILLFTVLGVEQAISIYRTENLVKEINKQTMQQVKTVLKQKQRIPTASYLRRLLDSELSKLSAGSNDSGLLALLAQVGPILKQSSGIELDSIKYDSGKQELKLDASGKDFADFEKLRTLFSDKFKTEMGRLNRNEKNVTGAFVLQKE